MTSTGSLMMDTLHDDDPFGASLLNGSQALFGSSPAFDTDPLYHHASHSPLLVSVGAGGAPGTAGAANTVSGLPSSPPITPMKGLGGGVGGVGVALLPPVNVPSASATLGDSPVVGGYSNGNTGGGNGSLSTRNARRRSPSPSESCGSTDSEDFLSDGDTCSPIMPRAGGAVGNGTGTGIGGTTQRTQHQMHEHPIVPKHRGGIPPPPMYLDSKKQGAVKGEKKHTPSATATDALTGLPVASFTAMSSMSNTLGALSSSAGGGDSDTGSNNGSDSGTLNDADAFDASVNMAPNTKSTMQQSTSPVAVNITMQHQRPPPPPILKTPQQQEQERRLFGVPGGNTTSAAFSQSIGAMSHMTSNGVMPMGDTSKTGATPLMPTMARAIDPTTRPSVPRSVGFGAAQAFTIPAVGDGTSGPSVSTMPLGGLSLAGASSNDGSMIDVTGASAGGAVAGASGGGIHVSANGRVETESVRKRRLARKAELARSSRRKKKQRLIDLEGEVAQLQEELDQAELQRKRDLETIAELRAQNAAVQAQAAAAAASHAAAAAAAAHQQQHDREQQLTEAAAAAAKVQQQQEAAAAAARARVADVGTPAQRKELDSDVRAALKAITSLADNSGVQAVGVTTLIADFCAKLNQMGAGVASHVGELADTPLVPLPVRFLEWAMSQDDPFFESKTQLWSQLFAKIGYSQQQMQKLLAFRERMKAQRVVHKAVVAQTEALRSKHRELYATANKNFDEIRQVFTERQLVQFFAWCQTNELCVNALMGSSP